MPPDPGLAAPIRNRNTSATDSGPLTCNVAAWRMLRIPQKGPGYMRIRLHGTEDECQRAANAIATVLDVQETSSPYPNRPPSRLVRLYLTVTPPPESQRSRS